MNTKRINDIRTYRLTLYVRADVGKDGSPDTWDWISELGNDTARLVSCKQISKAGHPYLVRGACFYSGGYWEPFEVEVSAENKISAKKAAMTYGSTRTYGMKNPVRVIVDEVSRQRKSVNPDSVHG